MVPAHWMIYFLIGNVRDFYYLQWLWRKRGICQENVKEISYLCLWAWGLGCEVALEAVRGGPEAHGLPFGVFVCLFVHCKHLNDYCWAYILEIFFTSNCNKLNKCLYIQRKYSQNFLNWSIPKIVFLFILYCVLAFVSLLSDFNSCLRYVFTLEKLVCLG